jgi:hypothetical protein
MKYKNLNNVVLIKAPCNKVILTDVDGVLLDWEWAFNVWMQEHGFEEVPGSKLNYDMSVRYGIPKEQVTKLIRIFNESAAIGFLPALRDAMYYVKRLHEEHGYVFHCITSLSLDPNAGKLREMNLHKLFGKQAFERIVCLDTGADKPENAVVGHRAGLRSLLVEHGHNMHFYHGGVRIVKNWKEIYQLITSQE